MEQQATHVEQQQEQQEGEDTPGPYPIEQLQVGTVTCNFVRPLRVCEDNCL